MKNYNIFGLHWKIRLLKGGTQKNNIEGGDYLKRGGLGLFADLRWDLPRKMGRGGGLRPQCALWKYLLKQSEEYCCTCDGTTTFPKEIKNVIPKVILDKRGLIFVKYI